DGDGGNGRFGADGLRRGGRDRAWPPGPSAQRARGAAARPTSRLDQRPALPCPAPDGGGQKNAGGGQAESIGARKKPGRTGGARQPQAALEPIVRFCLRLKPRAGSTLASAPAAVSTFEECGAIPRGGA